MTPVALRRAGEVVLANLLNPHEGRRTPGKGARPAILIEPDPGGGWLVMGISSNQSEPPRREIFVWGALGLHARSYLWGTTNVVPAMDVHTHVGWVTDAVVDDLVELVGLDATRAAPLREAAREHHAG